MHEHLERQLFTHRVPDPVIAELLVTAIFTLLWVPVSCVDPLKLCESYADQDG